MKAELVITGMAELHAALRLLPETLAGEAADILLRNATDAADAIRNAYPEAGTRLRPDTAERTGTLRKGVRVDQVESSGFGASVRVISAAKHAHLYELGTARGGRPHPTFVPNVQRARRQITVEQIALVRRQGFEVSGGFI